LSIGCPPQPAARALRAEVFLQFPQPARVVHDVKQPGERSEQDGRPEQRPAQTLVQVTQKIQQIRHAERREQPGQKVTGNTQWQKGTPRQIRAERAYPIMGGFVWWKVKARDVTRIERKLRDQQQQRGSQQRDPDDIGETVV